MPAQRTYGKKTRLLSSNIVFHSPSKESEDAGLAQITDHVSKLALSENAHVDTAAATAPRKILRQKSGNTRAIKKKTERAKNDACQETQVDVSVEVINTAERPCNAPSPRRTDPSTIDSVSDLERAPLQVPSPIPKARETAEAVEVVHASAPPSDPINAHLGPLLALTTSSLTSFAEFDASLSLHFSIEKIAEASYSQVFSLGPSIPSSKPLTPSVLKLIPLTPPLSPRRATKTQQAILDLSSTPANVASEVRLLRHLTQVPGHTTYRGLHLLRGLPGPTFAAAYKSFNAAQQNVGKETSLFPNPARKGAHGSQQLWAVIEMADAGIDLERFMEGNEWEMYGVWGMWDVFWQVVCAYAKGEVAAKWETRDGHCGNICVRRFGSSQKKGDAVELTDVNSGVAERWKEMQTRGRKLGASGLEVTIIDYTISRAEIPDPDGGKAEVAFNDLDEDPAIFEGDAAEDYQYEMYRCMRAAAMLGDPLAKWDEASVKPSAVEEIDPRDAAWKAYHPETNVIWLHFVLHKLLVQRQGQEIVIEGGLSDRETAMLAVLEKAREALDLKNWSTSGLRSASDLIALALQEAWLDVEDVMGMVGEPKQKKRRAKCSKPRRAKDV